LSTSHLVSDSAAPTRRESLIRAALIPRVACLMCVGFLSFVPTIREEDAPQPQPPREAAKAMIVPDGFSVSLFAGEPDVRQPISFCIDDRGRLWVAEAYNYPERGAKELKDRVLILEDQDGDGTFDKRTVFHDELRYVTGIEVGFGGVWIMSPPRMLFIPDKNGDDRPDGEPITLLDGFGSTQSNHNIANGFTWGPDGWLYAGHGRTSPSDVGKPDTPKDDRIHFDGGVFRYHPTRRIFEPFADGTTNPWGVDFDDYGQAFVSNCVNPHLFHVIQGAHYEPWRGRRSSRYAYERIKTLADHLHWVGKKAGDSAGGKPEQLILGGGHAHSGTMVYLGDNWPDRYRNTVFMCNIHGKRINNDLLERKGSGYVARHGKDVLISKDPWFMGVTLRTGHDGGVFVSDWSDTGECHSYKNTQRGTGRIYKITHGKPTAMKPDVANLDDEELVRLQLHKNDWWVRRARRNLQERAAAGRDMEQVHESLGKILATDEDPTRKLRALWALWATDGLTESFLVRQLDHKNEYVRAWSVRLLCEQGAPSADAVKKFANLAGNGSSPLVRLELACALQRLPLEQRWKIAAGLIVHEEDAGDPNLPLMTWYGIEPLVKTDLARALGLSRTTKIPLIRRFIARRAAE
ncbi:MAG: hypothetical protein N2C14_27540, partial [Planctomycetales bacterium]